MSFHTVSLAFPRQTLRRWLLPVIALGVVQLIGCLTVNVYFPEAAIRDLSEQIESEVRREAGIVPTPSPVEPSAGTRGDGATFRLSTAASAPTALGELADLLLSAVWTVPAYAQQSVPEPTLTNPAIRKIIASRSARLAELNRFKDSGAIGENNRALVEILDLERVADLRERATLQRLVKDENSDREKLFREIAAAEDVELSQLDRIQETYAATMRQYARQGDMIQLPDGNWIAKG